MILERYSTILEAHRLSILSVLSIKRIDRKLKNWHTIHVANAANHPEGPQKRESMESKKEKVEVKTMKLTVKQPERIQSLLTVLSDLESISERVSETADHDLGSGGPASAGAGSRGDDSQSIRAQAIKSLPSTSVMRGRLTRHLEHDVRQLERRAKRMARRVGKGSAYLLNELYARIRKIQALIAELVDATAEVVRRLYIRLFVDHQQLV